MKAETKYKLEVGEKLKSSSLFSDIEDRVNFKKTRASLINWKLATGFTLGAVATVAIVLGLSNVPSTTTGALAYQLSPSICREVATSQASPNLLRPAMAAPILEKKTHEKSDLSDILYDVDSLITNKNSYKIKDIDSDKEDYAYAQVVSYTLLSGEESEYTLYFNDLTVNETSKEKKSSTEKSFEGLAVTGNIQMSFSFESKEEVKNNKSSYSSITTIYENDSKSDYLVISSESETKKNKAQEGYKYEHFTNATLDDTYSISYDVKKNKTTVVVETSTEKYTIEKKVTEKKEKFSIHKTGDNRNSNITYTKVIEDNGNVEYSEEAQ